MGRGPKPMRVSGGALAFPSAARGSLGAILALLLGVFPAAGSSLSVGVRAGYSDIDGGVFEGSGDLGGTPLFGLQAVFHLPPAISLVLAGEARNEEFRFDQAVWNDRTLRGRGEWKDQALFATLRLRTPGLVGLYGGVGGGIHFHKSKLDDVEWSSSVRRPPADGTALEDGDPLEAFLDEVEREVDDAALHFLAGLDIVPLAGLFEVFVEGRLEEIQGTYGPRSTSVYGGLNLRLP